MNKITIELCTADRARLDRLTAALENFKPDNEALQETPTEVAAPAETTPAEESANTITHDMIQQRVKDLIANGSVAQNEAARKAVTSRARNISGLPIECLAEVWAELEALGEPTKEG